MSDQTPGEQLYDVIRNVRPLHQYLAKVVEDVQAHSLITMPMRAALERLADGGPQTVPTVARSLWLSRQFVQRLVNEALELGLVELRDNPAHRRSPLVALTSEGQAAFTEIHAAELANLTRIAEELDGVDITGAQQVVAHLTGVFAQVAKQGLPDEGWSVPDLPTPDLPAKDSS